MKASKWKKILQEHKFWLSPEEDCKNWSVQFLLPTASSNYWHKWFGAPDDIDDDFLIYKTRKDKMYFLWDDVKGIKFLNDE